eukprot:TRINITY_DN1051_c0_g2_i1.p1 TRINITY_DN1051_c0_g2~~TRINITY_DN1051_c0_g2_i1.p1  ORF type:complete len:531 (-),score=140.11 TRINITY_DN1051_c0_g2_i1:158-1750(-)
MSNRSRNSANKRLRRSAPEPEDEEFQLDDMDESKAKRKSRRKSANKVRYTDPEMAPPSTDVNGVRDEDMKECYQLLLTLMSDPEAEAFLEPVDYVALELWHYPEIVKIPMDLGSIKQMLLRNTLANPAHFADHIRLVFKNAMEFNQPGSGIFVAATDPEMAPPSTDVNGVRDEDMKECYQLLLTLMSDPEAEAFLEPVDYVALELWHYPEIVKIPMDLGSIKQMLLRNTLANPAHFADHIRLVFKNAMEFNQPGSGIFVAADNLLHKFEDMYKKLFDSWFQIKQDDDMIKMEEDIVSSSHHHSLHHSLSSSQNGNEPNGSQEKMEIEQLQKTIESLKQSINNMKKKIDSLKKSSTSKKKKSMKPKRIRLTAPKAPLTYKEKEELCYRISKLDPKNLAGLVEIVSRNAPSNTAEEEVEIEIDSLDEITLLEVKKYVDKCIGKPKSRSTKRSRSSGSSIGGSGAVGGGGVGGGAVGSGGGGGGSGSNGSNSSSSNTGENHVNVELLMLAQSQTSKRITSIEKQMQDIRSQQH